MPLDKVNTTALIWALYCNAPHCQSFLVFIHLCVCVGLKQSLSVDMSQFWVSVLMGPEILLMGPEVLAVKGQLFQSDRCHGQCWGAQIYWPLKRVKSHYWDTLHTIQKEDLRVYVRRCLRHMMWSLVYILHGNLHTHAVYEMIIHRGASLCISIEDCHASWEMFHPFDKIRSW